jgi:hypothetical protein
MTTRGAYCNPLEHRAKELLRSLLIAPTLHQDIAHVIVLVHGSPQVVTCAIDRQKHRVQMPLVARSGSATPQLIGLRLPKRPTPSTDGFVGHTETTLEEERLHVAVAQGTPIVKPDSMADDCAGKTVVLVLIGVCRGRHAWLPILGSLSHRGGIARSLCHGSESRGNKWTTPRPGSCLSHTVPIYPRKFPNTFPKNVTFLSGLRGLVGVECGGRAGGQHPAWRRSPNSEWSIRWL